MDIENFYRNNKRLQHNSIFGINDENVLRDSERLPNYFDSFRENNENIPNRYNIFQPQNTKIYLINIIFNIFLILKEITQIYIKVFII